MKKLFVDFLKDEEGLETIEMVIILVIVVGLALAFRDTLVNWYNALIGDLNDQAQHRLTNAPTPGI